MDTQKIDLFVIANGDLFPSDKLAVIRQKLQNVNDEKWSIITTTHFKSPNKALAFSLLFGNLAVDRFYVGLASAWLKLLTCGGFGILTIKDWFTITNATREQNYQKLQELLR